MDRYWLLTWTTYGTWLPGDERGFVGAVRQNSDGTQATHNQPGTEYDRERPHLEGFAKATQKLPTSRLTREQAAAVCKQIQATAAIRQWKLFAIAVMANHVHLVVGGPGDPEPNTLLRDFKSYCRPRTQQNVRRTSSLVDEIGINPKTPRRTRAPRRHPLRRKSGLAPGTLDSRRRRATRRADSVSCRVLKSSN